jgi:hypothetical protein
MEKGRIFLACILIIIASFSSTPSFGAPMIKEMDIGLFTDAPSHIEATRYYLRYHAPEIVRLSGPWLRRYETYQAYDPPKEAIERFGAVAGRYSELWFTDVEEWNTRPPLGAFTKPNWDMKRMAAAQTIARALPSEEFLNLNPHHEDTPIIRWLTAIKYPEGVSIEEGEKWFLEVHAREAKNQPGLLKFISYRSIPEANSQWVRVNEYWYKDFAAWRKAVIESPPKYTQPSWGGQYPFVIMTSTFLDVDPDYDFLKGGYTVP